MCGEKGVILENTKKGYRKKKKKMHRALEWFFFKVLLFVCFFGVYPLLLGVSIQKKKGWQDEPSGWFTLKRAKEKVQMC